MKQLATVVAGLAALALAVSGTALAAAKQASPGAVYALTNAVQGNAVAVYDRAPDGRLSPPRLYPTSGLGNGTGLGSQGGLALTADGRVLLAVNPGSGSVSAFAVSGNELRLLDVVSSFGSSPISIAVRKDVAFVVNGGSLSIFGYRITRDGLSPIAGSGRALSPGASTVSQIAFAPNGVLVITERGSNTLDSFVLGADDIPSAPIRTASTGGAPFGFDFAHGFAVVADADAGPGNSAATSYTVAADGTITPNGAPVLTGQAAACWLVGSKDGRYVFTANAGSGSISTFAVAANGALSLVTTTVVSAGTHIVDEAVSGNGRYLYVLADRTGQVYAFRIEADGSLAALGAIGGLAAGAGGLAAQ